MPQVARRLLRSVLRGRRPHLCLQLGDLLAQPPLLRSALCHASLNGADLQADVVARARIVAGMPVIDLEDLVLVLAESLGELAQPLFLLRQLDQLDRQLRIGLAPELLLELLDPPLHGVVFGIRYGWWGSERARGRSQLEVVF